MNWSEEEVKALYVVLYGMAASDGEVDRSEVKAALSHVIKKTGEDLFSYNFSLADELVKVAESDSVEQASSYLKRMTPEKKDAVINGLQDVMSADGVIKKEEVKFLDKVVSLIVN